MMTEQEKARAAKETKETKETKDAVRADDTK